MNRTQRQARVLTSIYLSLGISLVFAALLALPGTARANMAASQPEWRAGDQVREPFGLFKSVHIERETLLIDLRPLADLRPAVVEATYKVRNDGEARDVALVFVADGLGTEESGGGWVWTGAHWVRDPRAKPVAEAGIWLDGQRVEATRAETGTGESLPDKFQPPAETPAIIESLESLPYKTEGHGTISFRVTLAPGPHVFVVRYAARPSAFSDTRTQEINWQLAYVLSPAKLWESFGGLDAKVLLPEKWRAASDPAMEAKRRPAPSIMGHNPADSLAFTFQDL